MERITIKNIEKANIMVLIIKRIIEKNLEDEKVYYKIKELNQKLVVRIGNTPCTIHFVTEKFLLKMEMPQILIFILKEHFWIF